MIKRFNFRYVVVGVSSTVLATMLTSFATFGQEKPRGSLWNHNGSIVLLAASGEHREFFYQKPRVGMVQAGARSGDLLFSGTMHDGFYYGTAYTYNAKCGTAPYVVSGPILDNAERVILRGDAPRFDRNCKISGYLKDTLEFTFLAESKANDAASTAGISVPGLSGEWKLLPEGSVDRRFRFTSDDGKINISANDLSCQIDELKPELGGSFSGHAKCAEESTESLSIETFRIVHVKDETFLIESDVILRTTDVSSNPTVDEVHHDEPATIRIYKRLPAN